MRAGPEEIDGLFKRARAYWACLAGMSPVEPLAGRQGAKALPGEFVIRPGRYLLGESAFALDRGGVYRLQDEAGRWRQRVVFDGSIIPFLSGLAWSTAHGGEDNDLPVEELCRIAMVRKPRLTCGYVANFGAFCLSGCGLKAHIVTALALEDSPIFGRSHNMLEFYAPSEGKWILCDLSFNAMFASGGRLLSFFEFFSLAGTGDFETVPLVSAGAAQASTGGNGGAEDFSFAYEYIARRENLRAYYHHLCRVPLVYDYSERLYRFCDQERISLVQSLSEKYRYLDRDDFIRRYYAAA